MGYDPYATDEKHRREFGPGPDPSLEGLTNGTEYVYYLQLKSGLIKIGTSHNILSRLRDHRRSGQLDEVLAIESGGRALEAQRHKEFDDLRLWPEEHFYPGRDLLDHIDSLRSALGLTA